MVRMVAHSLLRHTAVLAEVVSGYIFSLSVVLGRQTQEGFNPNEVFRNVILVVKHPSYNTLTSDNDIALLKLSSPVTFTDYIRPVCLAADLSVFHSGTDSWITGWGNIGEGVSLPSPQVLQEVKVPVIGNRQCNCLYGDGEITDNMICAGLLEGGKDSCQGDSGGPMVSRQNGSVWVQSGVVSFGIGCAQPDYPGVYTRVSRYQEWISSFMCSDPPGFVQFTSAGNDSDNSITCPLSTHFPSSPPSSLPTHFPSSPPSSLPTRFPPSSLPTHLPSSPPSSLPTHLPSSPLSFLPTHLPSPPSSLPTHLPSSRPSSLPTRFPSSHPSSTTMDKKPKPPLSAASLPQNSLLSFFPLLIAIPLFNI